MLARFRVLHSAITWAQQTKLIIVDPLDGMHAPAGPHPRLHLRPEQVRQLIATADQAVDKARARLAEQPHSRQRMLNLFRAEQNALLVRLAADTGARRGELTALKTTDLQGRVLTISRASQDGIIGPVKNHLNARLTLTISTAAYSAVWASAGFGFSASSVFDTPDIMSAIRCTSMIRSYTERVQSRAWHCRGPKAGPGSDGAVRGHSAPCRAGVSHLTNEGVPAELPPKLAILQRLCDDNWHSGKAYCRSHTAVNALLGYFDLIWPGMVWAPQWRPEESASDVHFPEPSHSVLWAGVGQKPVPASPFDR